MAGQFVLTETAAQAIAEHWIESWNNKDMESIMNHFADNIEFNSPLISRVLNEPGKTKLTSKKDIRNYFEIALKQFPDLHMELIQVLLGTDSVAIYYKSINSRLVVEVFFVDQAGKVYRTFNHYAAPKSV